MLGLLLGPSVCWLCFTNLPAECCADVVLLFTTKKKQGVKGEREDERGGEGHERDR